jgi:hypothetical protein
MSVKSSLSRRAFVPRTAGGLAAPGLVPASARGADGTTAPANRITVGLIGRGCMGRGHLQRLVGDKDVQVLAVCDVDRSRCQEGKEVVEANYAVSRPKGSYSGCATYSDYREVLARADIDAVVVVTPDHWHTPISVHAVKAGKDVYCEKPVSLTLRQGRVLVEAVRANKRVFQTGSQYRSMQTFNEAIAFVRAGGLGKVKQVFTIWGWQHVPVLGKSRVPLNPVLPEEPVPDGLDWNQWVGPAPWHPFNHHYHRNPIPGVVPWNFCEDFGLGPSTSYHSHAADVIQYALGVEESGPVELIHPTGGGYPTLTCRYANGTLLHHVDGWGQVKALYKAVPQEARLEGNFGGVFVGERGWLSILYGGGKLEAGPESLFDEMKLKRREVSGANNHHANWFGCIKSRERPSSHEEIGHRAASLGQLVSIAYKLERSLKWDPAKEVFEGDEEANRLMARPMRAPWTL